jgi:hypothetical protein
LESQKIEKEKESKKWLQWKCLKMSAGHTQVIICTQKWSQALALCLDLLGKAQAGAEALLAMLSKSILRLSLEGNIIAL